MLCALFRTNLICVLLYYKIYITVHFFFFNSRTCFWSAFPSWVLPLLKMSVQRWDQLLACLFIYLIFLCPQTHTHSWICFTLYSGTQRWDITAPTLQSSWWEPSLIWEMTRTPLRSWRRRSLLPSPTLRAWPWLKRLVCVRCQVTVFHFKWYGFEIFLAL